MARMARRQEGKPIKRAAAGAVTVHGQGTVRPAEGKAEAARSGPGCIAETEAPLVACRGQVGRPRLRLCSIAASETRVVREPRAHRTNGSLHPVERTRDRLLPGAIE